MFVLVRVCFGACLFWCVVVLVRVCFGACLFWCVFVLVLLYVGGLHPLMSLAIFYRLYL